MKSIITLVAFLSISYGVHAGEGMWLPQLLKALNEGEMQTMGMKLTAEQIYSVNNSSMKDAIVHFGGFCTAEVISNEGLILTNHHCGYGQIQSHSTVEDNYLKDGFWAQSRNEELKNPELFARFLNRIDDVTDVILSGVSDDMKPEEKQSIVDKNIADYKSKHKLKKFEELQVKPFYHGNQYFAFFMESYPDVRLVGTPPESIGKFGSDTDNWVWPRHTGDFSLFRIYAGPDNEPAEYSENNKPYQPKYFLPISLDGIEEGDFTMVFGYPGRTNQYLPSPAIKQLVEVLDPARIEIRDAALKIMDKYMRKSEKIKIQYASKYARIANYWKKWIGEKRGLERSQAIAKKVQEEELFDSLVQQDSVLKEKYGHLTRAFKDEYAAIDKYAYARDYYNEIVRRNVEIFRIAKYLNTLIKTYEKNGEEVYNQYLEDLNKRLARHFKNYNPTIDMEVMQQLCDLYRNNVNENYCPVNFAVRAQSLEPVVEDIFKRSKLRSDKAIEGLLTGTPQEVVGNIQKDPIYILYKDWKEIYDTEIAANYNKHKANIDLLQKKYMKALMEVFPERRFWPDANSTMRVSYGKVQGYYPKDAVYYKPQTYLEGVIEKYIPDDYEFDVDPRLLELYRTKDYGMYADSTGSLPICFIGSNHTTGGNSGSPAIDAHGNLIGLNFDRAWEGTMSDVNYDSRICRNIMVDIRYVLFIIDKHAKASHLIDEMKLVHPKAK